MSKLTEIKERVESFNADPNIYGVVMTVDEMNHLLSLLEEKDKALEFYADEKNYVDGYERKFNDGTVIELTTYVNADEGLIARKALTTSSNNEGEI
ncbi:hypothetical protein NST48_01500 [Paenibacillus sp. FSL M7-0547]|uniref:hypothetical protein n=1 Tax=Paenibacillus sp. FSL M7-0547 TaxID=2954755 RepID=UPI0030F8255D